MSDATTGWQLALAAVAAVALLFSRDVPFAAPLVVAAALAGVVAIDAERRRARGDAPAPRREGRGPRVSSLTTFDLDEYVYEALRVGASGFLLKDTPPEQLVDAIHVVANGDALLSPVITRRVIEEFVRRPPESVRKPSPALRGADCARARDPALHRPRALERRDREGRIRLGDHREDPRRARAHEAPAARSGAGCGVRVRERRRVARRDGVERAIMPSCRSTSATTT